MRNRGEELSGIETKQKRGRKENRGQGRWRFQLQSSKERKNFQSRLQNNFHYLNRPPPASHPPLVLSVAAATTRNLYSGHQAAVSGQPPAQGAATASSKSIATTSSDSTMAVCKLSSPIHFSVSPSTDHENFQIMSAASCQSNFHADCS